MLLLATAVTVSLALLIALLFTASVLRRLLNERKYRMLDRLRSEITERVQQALSSSTDSQLTAPVPGSLPWQALESVLFNMAVDDPSSDKISALFSRLGFVSYHEGRIERRSRLVRATSIDALGRMRSVSSVPKLVPLLGGSDSEILTVTVRSLSRIGSREALTAVIERLSVLLGSSLVTRKAMERSLLNFGSAAIPELVRVSHAPHTDPWVISCVLETLSHLPPDLRSARFASTQLTNPHAEVRSKALKVLCASGSLVPRDLVLLILPLLDDPVWFVRIQAVRTVEGLRIQSACPKLGLLLFDPSWNVRDQATVALTKFPEVALDIFIDVLKGTDKYAKSSVCEQIEKTGFCDDLMKNLVTSEQPSAQKSREILALMYQLDFWTPFREYLAAGADEAIKRELRLLAPTGAA
jgi:HEAT repeat protein